MSRYAKNSVKANMAGWIAPSAPMVAFEVVGPSVVSMAAYATCINIALTHATDGLESWCNKWL